MGGITTIPLLLSESKLSAEGSRGKSMAVSWWKVVESWALTSSVDWLFNIIIRTCKKLGLASLHEADPWRCALVYLPVCYESTSLSHHRLPPWCSAFPHTQSNWIQLLLGLRTLKTCIHISPFSFVFRAFFHSNKKLMCSKHVLPILYTHAEVAQAGFQAEFLSYIP